MPATPKNVSTSATIRSRRDAALDFLLGRINYERTPTLPYGKRQLKLDRMRQLLTRLGNPDAGLPIVHIAGTKGKGSTAALAGSILHASGYDVGLFSSPHLERIEERFAINGLPCASDDLVALVDELRPVVSAMDQEAAKTGENSLSPTYFELTTAVALMYFARRKVDLAVLEVGLGGRLDSTNVCQPVVTVITSISFDHTKQLGNTLAKIAGEKAGIIKPGVPVLCGPLSDEPREVIAGIAKQHGCRLIEAGKDFTHAYQAPTDMDRRELRGRLQFATTIADQQIELSDLPIQLLGEHQAANASLAVATCLELQRQGWSISPEAIRAGLRELSLPGRIEIIRRQPTVVLDVAHNVASANALVEVLKACCSSDRRVLVLAVSKDKDVRGIVRALLPFFDQVIATEYRNNPRVVPAAQLSQIVVDEISAGNISTSTNRVHECSDAGEALQLAEAFVERAKSEQPLVCVTGSFFIVAELRQALIAGA